MPPEKGIPSSTRAEKAYLETGALIHLAGRDDGPQEEMYKAVISLLSDAELVTGRFVIFELMFGYLTYLDAIFAKLKIAENMEEFLDSLNTGNLDFQPNKRRTFAVIQKWLIGRFFESSENRASWNDFQEFALNALGFHYRSVLRRGNKMLRVTNLNCHPELDDYKGKLDGNGFLRVPNRNCEDQEFDCGLSELRRGQSFKDMHRACRRCRDHNRAPANSELGKRNQALHAVRNSPPEEVMDTSRCRQIGDGLVALDCPSNCDLVTPNGKHYQEICEALGIELRTYSSR